MTEPAYAFPRQDDGPDWPAQGGWTYDDFLRLPDDGQRYEVIRGCLYVTPPPILKHQFSSFELAFQFSAFVREHDLGLVLTAPLGVILPAGIANPVQPDVMFFRKGNEPRWETSNYEGVPDLIAEILSPKTQRRDRTTKLQAYQDAGVAEYWIVDPQACSVVVYGLERGKYKELVRGGEYDMVGSSVVPGFRVKVRGLFMP
ncbi:MAG TPA: Uma2 family endonuclease [Thermoanaerobaculia bacterium]|jgi:Uma2 family endonuclease|nr:Uma2 family endonuclease [Thermoanaerobaculia bacterium]